MIFTSDSIEKKADALYLEISAKLDKAFPHSDKPAKASVLLRATDVVLNDGFWAKVWEDCFAGIKYELLDESSKIIGWGQTALHKVPWTYNRAVKESQIVMDIVARELVTRFNRNGMNDINITGRNNSINYRAVSGIFGTFKSPLEVLAINNYRIGR